MRRVTFDTPIQFYAPSETVAALRDKAARERRTLSEILRDVLRRELSEAA